MRLEDAGTIGKAFAAAARRYGGNAFLCVPADDKRGYHGDGWSLTYAQALEEVERLRGHYAAAGYGHGHRVAVLLDNRPEHLLHKLALNGLGVSIAPVNPDYRPAETAYLLDHCTPDLFLVLGERESQARAALDEAEHGAELVTLDGFADALPHAPRPAPRSGTGDGRTEASLLYTSGTTGRPKGCIISHEYELAVGDWYVTRGGTFTLREHEERVFNPLPLYHVNAAIVSFFGVMAIGCCQIIPDRFHPSTWWRDVAATEATIVHYLGVIVSLLMKRPPAPEDTNHNVRLGIGAGIEPTLHDKFEQRFGFPMVEIWGMTEAVRLLTDCHEPRRVGKRAIGAPVDGLEAKVVDGDGNEVASDEPGEMVIRYSEDHPRKHAFSGYLHDDVATEDAWRDGWFHTGDTVTQGADGMIYFVDRQKNIIRRSGENISAAEIEAVLLDHDAVHQVAVMAVPDELRDEEVLACITTAPDHAPSPELAEELFAHCDERLAYFKPPGWILFVDDIPKTGTQKIQKHLLFPDGEDPTLRPGIVDLRARKKRG